MVPVTGPNKPLLICGTAQCLWDDLAAVGAWPGDVMAINMAAWHVPLKVKHWVSVHPEMFLAMEFYRWFRRDCQNFLPVTHASEKGPGVDSPWQFRPHDYSGYFACRIAMELGYQRCILAGIPMDASQSHYYGAHHAGKFDPYPMNEVWDTLPQNYFRSMSGKTREKFGYPDAAEIGNPFAVVSGTRAMQLAVA